MGDYAVTLGELGSDETSQDSLEESIIIEAAGSDGATKKQYAACQKHADWCASDLNMRAAGDTSHDRGAEHGWDHLDDVKEVSRLERSDLTELTLCKV